MTAVQTVAQQTSGGPTKADWTSLTNAAVDIPTSEGAGAGDSTPSETGECVYYDATIVAVVRGAGATDACNPPAPSGWTLRKYQSDDQIMQDTGSPGKSTCTIHADSQTVDVNPLHPSDANVAAAALPRRPANRRRSTERQQRQHRVAWEQWQYGLRASAFLSRASASMPWVRRRPRASSDVSGSPHAGNDDERTAAIRTAPSRLTAVRRLPRRRFLLAQPCATSKEAPNVDNPPLPAR
jgi:hypothetical protein